jgi:hypothetical protein
MSVPSLRSLTLPKIGSAAAGADEIARIARNDFPFRLAVESVYFTPEAAVTASDTNNATLTIKIGSTTIGTLVTNVAQGDLVAGTPVKISVSGILTIQPGAVMSVTKTYAGSGAAMIGTVSALVSEARV